MAEAHQQVIVADRDTMVRYWLKQQVAVGRMTHAAADEHWKDYSQHWQKLAN